MQERNQKTVYAYHQGTGEYLGETLADRSPLDVDEVWLVPAFATEQPPPSTGPRQVAVFRGEKWQVVADFRLVSLWSTLTAQRVHAVIGDTPASMSATELEPPLFAAWRDNHWTVDRDVERQAKVAEVELKVSACRAEADREIVPLQDAVDLEMATPGELAQLKAWKTYRVMLNRVPQQTGYPTQIEWPTAPA